MSNKFLILAYASVWAVFLLYAWSLVRRERRLEKELDDLRGGTDSGRAED
jgi:CcmD family protein